MTDELVAFSDPVQCEGLHGGTLLRLRALTAPRPGSEAEPLQLLLSGVLSAEPLPEPLRSGARLHAVRVLRLEPGRYRIEAREGRCEVRAAASQLHRCPAARFYGALPREPVPRMARAAWRVLLSVLHVPGVARLLARLQR